MCVCVCFFRIQAPKGILLSFANFLQWLLKIVVCIKFGCKKLHKEKRTTVPVVLRVVERS